MKQIFLNVFDLVLIITLLGLAWQLLAAKNIFKAVVLFISFGLLMALAWVRMNAPDVALAEAAIGAGITGPLCLSAFRRMQRVQKEERRIDAGEKRNGESKRS